MDIVEDIGDLSFDSGFGSPKRDTALTTSTGSRGTLDRSLSAKDFKDDLKEKAVQNRCVTCTARLRLLLGSLTTNRTGTYTLTPPNSLTKDH